MASTTRYRSVITLFSSAVSPSSHRVRIVLSEKGIASDLVIINPDDPLPEDVMEVNPYRSLPTLIDRDLAIYDARIVMEYLEERYPHPPFLPVDPINRARMRVFLYRIERDWYSAIEAIESDDAKDADAARVILRDSLHSISPIFTEKKFFMSDEFSLLDCSVAPILWRLNRYGITLGSHAKPLLQYAERLFKRDGFRASLTEAEKELG